MASYTLAKLLADDATFMKVSGLRITSPKVYEGLSISRVSGLNDRGPIMVEFSNGTNNIMAASTSFTFEGWVL